MKERRGITQIDMTEGAIWKQILLFSMPLLVGNLFQQLYNTMDSFVVGNFINQDALAAVSSSNSLINLLIGMFMGIATGAGVIISQYYGGGEREQEKLACAVHTCMALSLVGGALMIVVGIALSPRILSLMGTPESVMPNSVVYLRIYFGGALFNLFYNMGAGVLRAVGDSVWPLIYLCISSVINMALDLLFVLVFHWGTAGVGYATITAQGVCAICVLVTLMNARDGHRLFLSKLKINRKMMVRILKLGIPSGIQQSIISLSNVIVQSNINGFGSSAIAGFGAYSKVDGFAMLPLQSFCMAATTFTGQNVGAGKSKRVKAGMIQGIAISLVYTALISVLLYLNAEKVLRIFTPSQEVIAYGRATMVTLLPFYWTVAIHQILMGSIRGSGRTMVTMMIGVGNMCILRMIYINLLVPFFPSFEAVMWCYPITWLTTMLMDCIYSIRAKWIPKGD